MTINHVFAGIAVADYDAGLAWYKLFFGRSPDVIVAENECMWQVIDNGWIYVVGNTNHVSNTLLTLLVDNLDVLVAELVERGLETSEIDTAPGLYRKAVITDPDGNMISLGESLSTSA
jgi:predicted enzyme related to lactoylglutathione lyase